MSGIKELASLPRGSLPFLQSSGNYPDDSEQKFDETFHSVYNLDNTIQFKAEQIIDLPPWLFKEDTNIDSDPKVEFWIFIVLHTLKMF